MNQWRGGPTDEIQKGKGPACEEISGCICSPTPPRAQQSRWLLAFAASAILSACAHMCPTRHHCPGGSASPLQGAGGVAVVQVVAQRP